MFGMEYKTARLDSSDLTAESTTGLPLLRLVVM